MFMCSPLRTSGTSSRQYADSRTYRLAVIVGRRRRVRVTGFALQLTGQKKIKAHRKNHPAISPYLLTTFSSSWEPALRALSSGIWLTHGRFFVYKRVFWMLCLFAATATSLRADPVSFTGNLMSPEGVFEDTFTLLSNSTVTIQTWGFGGGTNSSLQNIGPGGFDPLITLFSGPPASATMVVDAFGNPLADADNLLNAPWSFVGNCPAAGSVAIGSDNDCGDVYMQAGLAEGTYTVVLTDANYIPNAVYDNGTLSEGFTDLTGGAFQTCDPVSNACITPNGNYAVDILYAQPDSPAITPEPSTLSQLGIGFAVLIGAKRWNDRRLSPQL
jgi:hypothetical protein